MTELTPQERLQPSLLDRLADDERVIAWRLEEDKTRLLAILDDQERAAFEKLFDVEQRRAPRLVAKDFEPFARLTEEQKALLERVVMLEQQRRFESREQRVMSLERLKQSVLRDLAWLLNTEYFEAVHSLDAYPEVKSSVVNYGIPSIVGLTITDLNDSMRGGLAKTLRDAIVRFEPRLDPDSIAVRTHADKEQMDGRTLTFEIEAELLAEPTPLRLLLTSVVDLENGHASLAERAA
jgi:type VI secretion system protein ImpF